MDGLRNTWCEFHGLPPSQLTSEVRDSIERGLAELMPSFGVAGYFREKRASLFDECDFASLARRCNGAIGFAAAKTLESPFGEALYVQTLLIAEKWHGTSVVVNLLHVLFEHWHARATRFPNMIVSKTANPKTLSIIRGFERWGCIASPSPVPNLTTEAAGRYFAGVLNPGAEYERHTGILRNVAGEDSSQFYKSKPSSGKAHIDALFGSMAPADRVLSCIWFPDEDSKTRMRRAFERYVSRHYVDINEVRNEK